MMQVFFLEGGKVMADITERQEGQGQDEEEHLQDTFISSFIIGLIILAIWVWIFIIYLNRM